MFVGIGFSSLMETIVFVALSFFVLGVVVGLLSHKEGKEL